FILHRAGEYLVINIGAQAIKRFYIGSTAIARIYKGATKVYESDGIYDVRTLALIERMDLPPSTNIKKAIQRFYTSVPDIVDKLDYLYMAGLGIQQSLLDWTNNENNGTANGEIDFLSYR